MVESVITASGSGVGSNGGGVGRRMVIAQAYGRCRSQQQARLQETTRQANWHAVSGQCRRQAGRYTQNVVPVQNCRYVRSASNQLQEGRRRKTSLNSNAVQERNRMIEAPRASVCKRSGCRARLHGV